MPPPIPAAVIEKARALRATGISLVAVADTLGYSREGLRLALDPAYREARNAQGRARKRKSRRAEGKPEARYIMPTKCPPEVLAERDRALSQQTDLTAQVFGDPPPARSALGKRISP
jgi:hypothetical protein